MSVDIERDRKALELRKAGASVERIAENLEYDDAESVIAAIHRTLELLPTDSLDDVARLELERLDAMQRALWPAVLKGQWLAVDRCLAIMERRAQLLGLGQQRGDERPEKDRLDQLAERRQHRLEGRAAATD